MREPEIVVLSRFPEIFEGFKKSVDRDVPEINKNLIWDSRATLIDKVMDGKWDGFQKMQPFQMATNANAGWRMVQCADILYAGDDTRIIEPNTIKRLQELAYSDDKLGILSPRIIGHAQTVQTHPTESPITPADFVAFVFVYIKREVIDAIGYLDERFEGYGMEDVDFCYRARLAGFKIGVAKEIPVAHGVGGHSYGSTFIKVRGEEQMGKDDAANRRRFAEKWGLDPNDTAGIFAAIRDLSATVSR